MTASADLREVEFGTEAVGYLRSQLSEGKTLSRQLLERPLAGGRVFSYLPATTDPRDASHRFESGGLVEVRKSLASLAHLTAAFLRGPGGLAVFEDQLAQPTDPWLRASRVPYFVYRSEVYHFLDSRDPDAIKRAEDLILAAKDYRYVGILTRPPQVPTNEVVSHAEVHLEVIRKLAAGARYVIVGAFDGEGALIWSIKD